MVRKGTRKTGGKTATAPRRAAARARSISATDHEWQKVEQFATKRGVSISDGARQLMRSGLRTEAIVEEYAEASAWQLAQAWAETQAIANGDSKVASWDGITKAVEQARSRIRERAAAQRAVRAGT